MKKPLLIIVNGLPGTGKTILATHLARDLNLPVFSRDGIYETLFDALASDRERFSTRMGTASFSLLYYVVDSILAAGKALIIEGFFGRPELRTAELVALQQRHDFEPFQILCRADGAVLVERFLARIESGDRHAGHADKDWLDQNRARLMRGALPPLALGGRLVEFDTTTPKSVDYDTIRQQLRSALS